ncbi:MAG TPA: hypothetical protein VFB66_27435 [Tepidisphaeraceae bacterium]|nr:hypothetical protein [Tepidisphaeraceae bacterium]
MFTYRTITVGQRVALWDKTGGVAYLDGPRRVWLRAGQRVQPLQRFAAAADQYLVVRHKDGRALHLHGPASVWFDPVEHESVEVRQALVLDANEAIVVYAQGDGPSGAVTRRVVRGPSLFMPAANEWLHEFRWHGSGATGQNKVPRGLQFTKLRVIPDQTYFDVQDVRTADDALLVIKLMIFFELADLDRMLDQTHDPVADFINAVSADVIDFVAGHTFDKFKERTDALNDLATYKALSGRAERIGYRITKVVYRGYHASNKLQSMHDNAIEARTRLRLEAETEAQAQELADLKLRREAERAEERRKMEESDLHHKNRLHRLTHEEQLRQRQVEHQEASRQRQLDRERRLEGRRLADEVELKRLAERNRERLAFLQSMHDMQVDLTRYLVAQYQHPDRVIRIDGVGATSNGEDARPQLHLHEPAG